MEMRLCFPQTAIDVIKEWLNIYNQIKRSDPVLSRITVR